MGWTLEISLRLWTGVRNPLIEYITSNTDIQYEILSIRELLSNWFLMHCLAKQVGQYYRRIRSQLIGSHHSSSPKLDECSSTDFSFASHLAALWPDLIYVPCCGYNSASPQLRKFSYQFLKTTYSKNPVQKKTRRTFEMMERVTDSGQIILQYLCWDHSQQSYCTNKLFGAVW